MASDLVPAFVELRRLHAEAVSNAGGDFEVDCDEAFRIFCMKNVPALLDAALWAVNLQADIKAGMDAIDRGEFTTVDKMRDELNAEVLDAAERCAAAEAQAKAAGELLRALKEAMDLIHDLRSYCRETWDWKYGKEWDDQTKAVAERIEAAERAGVKP